jgi:hypothetical protein
LVEKLGIPTVSIVRSDFTNAFKARVRGFGFPAGMAIAEVPPKMVFALPEEEFRAEIEGSIDKLVDGLTKWEPNLELIEKKVVAPVPEILTAKGDDYEEAVSEINYMYLKKNWGDGLPIMPPTARRVEWLLTGTDLPPDHLIGKIPNSGGYLTVQNLAVNAAMAGARPEYMPMLIAAFEAMLKRPFHLEFQVTSGNPVAPLMIVNGPMAKEARINSGYGCFGPDPRRPAGASIGRSIRLVLQNIGGVLPGVVSLSTHGQPGRYTGLVVAEDEDNSPWTLLTESQGFARGRNTVTMYGVQGQMDTQTIVPPHVEMSHGGDIAMLTELVTYLTWPYPFYFNVRGDEQGVSHAGVLVMNRSHARALAKVGWTKEKIQSYLYENVRIPMSILEKLKDTTQWNRLPPFWVKEWPSKTPIPIIDRPEGFLIIVAGGELGRNAWLPCGGRSRVAQTVEIERPKNWDKLITQSEIDLGPI